MNRILFYWKLNKKSSFAVVFLYVSVICNIVFSEVAQAQNYIFKELSAFSEWRREQPPFGISNMNDNYQVVIESLENGFYIVNLIDNSVIQKIAFPSFVVNGYTCDAFYVLGDSSSVNNSGQMACLCYLIPITGGYKLYYSSLGLILNISGGTVSETVIDAFGSDFTILNSINNNGDATAFLMSIDYFVYLWRQGVAALRPLLRSRSATLCRHGCTLSK